MCGKPLTEIARIDTLGRFRKVLCFVFSRYQLISRRNTLLFPLVQHVVPKERCLVLILRNPFVQILIIASKLESVLPVEVACGNVV